LFDIAEYHRETLTGVRINSRLNLQRVQLAEPTYGIPGEIDLLVGAGLFWSLL